MSKTDNFLAEAIKDKPKNGSLSYSDGFRFGIGFFVANLLMLVILGGLTWALASALHLR